MLKWITVKLTKNQAKALNLAAEIGIFERLSYRPDRRVKRDAMKALGKLKEAIKKEA